VNLEEVGRLLAVLKAAYPQQTILEQTPVAYQMALDDVPYDEAMAAAATHIKSSPFFPKPAELRAGHKPRMDPKDYQGGAYLDVPWMRGAMPRREYLSIREKVK
jgi:hypothetical protein